MSTESFENDPRPSVVVTPGIQRTITSPFFLGAIGTVVALVAMAGLVAFLS